MGNTVSTVVSSFFSHLKRNHIKKLSLDLVANVSDIDFTQTFGDVDMVSALPCAFGDSRVSTVPARSLVLYAGSAT